MVQVRHELERQLYVNQVLWRKLNALIDIHGSTTRLELIEELANYQGELAKLRTKSRMDIAHSTKINANARSTSGLLLETIYFIFLFLF